MIYTARQSLTNQLYRIRYSPVVRISGFQHTEKSQATRVSTSNVRHACKLPTNYSQVRIPVSEHNTFFLHSYALMFAEGDVGVGSMLRGDVGIRSMTIRMPITFLVSFAHPEDASLRDIPRTASA